LTLLPLLFLKLVMVVIDVIIVVENSGALERGKLGSGSGAPANLRKLAVRNSENYIESTSYSVPLECH
jgi:hypothetical protein